MNYQETLAYLYSQLPMYQRIGQAAYKADLSTTIALLDHLNNPEKSFKSIHIAGTNGKGSVAHMLASILQSAGFKVGLYTSPHLKDFRERIKINGEAIDESSVIAFVEENKMAFESIKPSFFEMTVGLAFKHFEKEQPDISIIETGMGGRLDSTNVLKPELSIITNIGFDHMQFLGNSLEKIAAEKAEIIKPGVPVVIGKTQPETENLFNTKALEVETNIFYADQNFELRKLDRHHILKQYFDVWHFNDQHYENLELPLKGNYQQENLCTVLQACELIDLHFPLNEDSIRDGLSRVIEQTGFYGRWQILQKTPLVIADTAHNREGLKEVVYQIRQHQYAKLHFVLGMVNDKNIEDLLDLLPRSAHYYFCKADIPRGLDEEILGEKATKAGLRGLTFPSVREAYSSAINNASLEDMVYIGGSTFVVAEII